MSAVPNGSLTNLLKHISGEKKACQCSLFHYFNMKSIKIKLFFNRRLSLQYVASSQSRVEMGVCGGLLGVCC